MALLWTQCVEKIKVLALGVLLRLKQGRPVQGF